MIVGTRDDDRLERTTQHRWSDCSHNVRALFTQCVAVRMLFYESAAKVTKLPALKRGGWH